MGLGKHKGSAKESYNFSMITISHRIGIGRISTSSARIESFVKKHQYVFGMIAEEGLIVPG